MVQTLKGSGGDPAALFNIKTLPQLDELELPGLKRKKVCIYDCHGYIDDMEDQRIDPYHPSSRPQMYQGCHPLRKRLEVLRQEET
jgi:hypothetical protein